MTWFALFLHQTIKPVICLLCVTILVRMKHLFTLFTLFCLVIILPLSKVRGFSCMKGIGCWVSDRNRSYQEPSCQDYHPE